MDWTTEKRKLKELIEWERNPRQLSEIEADHIKKSINKFGVVDPLIINLDNTIIGGHQRKRILNLLNDPEFVVDVRVPPRLLDEEEVAELNVRLNKNSGSWDYDVLANEFDMDDLLEWGFSEEELTGLDFGEEEPEEDPGAQIDKAEELREKWGVELGQLWQLGEHRLICGDCTDKAVVDRLMGGELVNVVVTDPPYGLGNTKSFNDNHEDYLDDKPFEISLLDLGKHYVIFGGNYYDWLPEQRNKIGWIVWDKRPNLEGDKRERADRIFGQHFEIAVTNVGGLRGKMFRFRWGGFYGSQEIFHKTQKPPELFEWCIENTEGMVVDYFLGSGTTIVACERLNRKCRAVEISPAYCAVAIERWSEMTGEEPELLDAS